MSSECLLPDYDVGSSVKVLSGPVPRLNHMSVHIDQHEKATFNRGDAVTGRVHFIPCQDTPFDRLLIDLQATETVVRGEMQDSSMVKSMSIARHKVQPNAYPTDMTFKRGYEYSFTFSLVVPHLFGQDHCSTKLPLHYQLPPTIGNPLDSTNQLEQVALGDVGDRSMSFSYRIRARVTRPIVAAKVPIITQVAKYVKVMPSYPAIQLEPTEFKKQTQLKYGLLKRMTKGEIEIFTKDTPTFHINDGQQTKMTLDIVYRGPPSAEFKPPPIKQLVYKLNAITTSTTSAMKYYPQPDDPAVHSTKDSFQTQMTTIGAPNWKVRSGAGNRQECFAQVEVALQLPKNSTGKLVPSFFSCLSSRQYNMSFILEFAGFSSIHFHLPAVIARDRRLNLLGMTHDSLADEEVVDPVPTYEAFGRAEHITLERGVAMQRRKSAEHLTVRPQLLRASSSP